MLPDYAGANLRGIVPALLGPAGTADLPGVDPGRRRRTPRRSCCSCSTASAGSSCRSGAHLAPTLSLDGRRPDHHRRAVDDGHRADLDHHRADPGRARPRRLPHRRAAATCSTCCGGRTGSGDARRRWVAARRAALRAVPRRRPSRSSAEGRARSTRRSREAHLRGVRHAGWRLMSTIPVIEVRRLLGDGEPFVYAYYDGIDKIAHEYGLGAFYDAELAAVDRLVADVLGGAAARRRARWSPPTTARSTSASGSSRPTPDVLAPRAGTSRARVASGGCTPGPAPRPTCCDAATAAHGDVAWVVTREQVLDEGWFGPGRGTAGRQPARRRGARGPRRRSASTTRPTPGRSGSCRRHGSLTSAEMLVPLLAGRNGSARTERSTRGPPTPIRTETETMSDLDRRPDGRSRRRSENARRWSTPAARGAWRRRRRRLAQTEFVERAGQGHAHRLDGQAAARRGARPPRSTTRSRERLAAIYQTLDRRAGLGAVARPAGRAEVDGAARSRATASRATPSCASPRPSSSAGWRGCSTASRRR